MNEFKDKAYATICQHAKVREMEIIVKFYLTCQKKKK
jgi:hypothetical protein